MYMFFNSVCILLNEVTLTQYIYIAVTVAGTDRLVCQGKCEDIPDCDGFCRRIGTQGGQCVPPLYQYCCCKVN